MKFSLIDFMVILKGTKDLPSLRYSEMTPSQQREYRRRRKRRRRLRVLINYALVIFFILLLIGAVTFFLSKDGAKNSTKKVNKQSNAIHYDLMVKNSDKRKKPSEKTEAKEEKEEETSQVFSASEDESTVAISLDSVVSPYAILINSDTGKIVATKNGRERIYPASMTKIMTVYTAAKHIKAESLSEKVTLSHEAVDYAYANDCSTSGFLENEEITVGDLFYGTICPSGGDAAYQLAMYVAGDVDTFIGMMNDEVSNLGLDQTTHFTNPVGIFDEDNYSTPYDIAMILEAAMADEICNKVLTTKVYESKGTELNPEGIIISNLFLRRIEDKEFGGQILGAKTGYVDQSGSCAASCEKSNSGTTYYCVTAGSSSSWRCIYDHVDIYSNYGK